MEYLIIFIPEQSIQEILLASFPTNSILGFQGYALSWSTQVKLLKAIGVLLSVIYIGVPLLNVFFSSQCPSCHKFLALKYVELETNEKKESLKWNKYQCKYCSQIVFDTLPPS
jgi:hypothetical protein